MHGVAFTHDRVLWWSARELRYAYLENGGFVEYRYNENGLRSLKKIYDDNGIDSDNYYYFWSDDGRLLAYTVDLIGSEDLYSVLVLYNSDKEPIGFTADEDTYYYLKNIQGDVLCVTDAEGTPIINYTYDAWGAMTAAPASQNVSNTVLARVAFLNPVTYRGYLYDYELGLYYLQLRFYDPETGRFVSARNDLDTFTGCNSTNLFLYDEIWIEKEKENARIIAYEKKQTTTLSEATVVASGENPHDKENTITVNCYSKGVGHADISIDGVIYSYGDYAKSGRSVRKQLLGKADGYIIWAAQNDWYQKEKNNGRKRTSYSFKVTEEVKHEILGFYSELFRCSIFDREPDNNLYYGQIFKVNSGKYRYYWALGRNCVTAVINALEYGIPDRLEATSYYMYEDYWKYKSIFIPAQLQWFMDYFKTLYPDTVRTRG